MTGWQTRARLGVAIFGVIVAAVVYSAVREREPAAAPAYVERLDPLAVMEGTGSELQRVRGEARHFQIAAARTLTYADGSSKLFEVTIDMHGPSGRDYVITAGEALAGAGQDELQLTGDVVLTASDGFTLSTGRGSFHRGDAIVRAPGDVTFAKGRMRGSGTGMTYDEHAEVLRFEDRTRVQMTDEAGDVAVRFTATGATLDRVRHVLTLEGGANAERQGQMLDAAQVTVQLSPDEDVITFIALRGDARVTGGSGSLDSMTARAIDLDYTDDGVTLERVEMTGAAALAVAGPDGSPGRRLFGDRLDLELAADGALTKVIARQAVRLELPGGEGVPARTIRAGTLDATGAEGHGLTDARFGDDVEFQETGSAGAPSRTVRSRALHAVFTGDGIGTASFSGRVVFEDGAFRASAAEAGYQPDEGVLRLRGDSGESPRVMDGRITIDAPTVDVSLDSQQMSAAGGVRTTVAAAAPAAGGGQGDGAMRLPGLLQQEAAAHVTAQSLEYEGARGRARFSGEATLWQEDTAIRADVMTVDFERGDLLATGSARSTISLDGGTSDGRAHEIRFDETARLVTFRGAAGTTSPDAHVSGPQGDVRAERVEIALARDGGRTERLEAYSRVRVTVGDRVATGDRLTYGADDERYVLSGTPADPVTAIIGCREVVGRTLTFFVSADRMIVDGHEETRTQTTSPGPCPQPSSR